MGKLTAHRSHEWSMGHRVLGHQGHCAKCHGHNYQITIHLECNTLDSVGRVVDFSVIKSTLIEWIEQNWDHKFMLNEEDPFVDWFQKFNPESLVVVRFNPTAENIATHLLKVVFPELLQAFCRNRNYDLCVTKVNLMETGKCGVEVSL